MITYRCPKCGYERQVTPDYEGRTARCPKCKTESVIGSHVSKSEIVDSEVSSPPSSAPIEESGEWEEWDDAFDEAVTEMDAIPGLPPIARKPKRKRSSSSKRNELHDGRVFATYYAVRLIKNLWIINVIVAVILLVATVVVTPLLMAASDENKLQILGIGISVIVSTLFELISLRIALETIAVFFDMLYELRRMAGDDKVTEN